MTEANRRTIDKATSLPSITVGFAILILAGTWWMGQRTQQYTSEIESLRVMIYDVQDRQRKYIGQGGTLTNELYEMHKLMDDLRVWIAATHSEMVP